MTVVEKPGLWMSDTELAQLVKSLQEVVKKSILVGDLDYGVLTGRRDKLSRAVITLISDNETGDPLAFNALAAMPCVLRGQDMEVLHLGLVVVAPGKREGGFSWILYGLTSVLIFLRNRLQTIWVSNVTQVPAIIGKVTESFSDVFPAPESSRRSFDHLSLARQINSRHREVFGVGTDADFDEKKFIFMNAYTGGSDHLKKTFEQAQPHRNVAYNDFCKNFLNYGRGDDFLQLGKMDINSTKNYLLRSVPRASLMAMAGGFFFLVLQGLILPVVSWFDTSRSYGDLRRWK